VEFSETKSTALARRLAPWVLGLVTLVWGLSFPWTKAALDAARDLAAQRVAEPLWAERAGLLAFTALRFGLAFAALWLWNTARGLRRLARAARQPIWRGGAVLGGFLIGGMLLNSEGLRDLEPAVSAFLTSLYVVFTALLHALWRRRWPHPSLMFGVLLAGLGAAWIDGPPQLNFGISAGLTLLSALLFAVQILAIDRYAPRVSGLVLTEALFLVAGLVSGLLLGLWLWLAPLDLVPFLRELVSSRAFLQPLALMVLLASLFALTAMQLFQRYLDPVRAALLYALEPLWAALFQAWFASQAPDGWVLLGGALVLGGNLVAELWPRLASPASTHP
jgi:drug/metabolite transporter (DMT)-like permease